MNFGDRIGNRIGKVVDNFQEKRNEFRGRRNTVDENNDDDNTLRKVAVFGAAAAGGAAIANSVNSSSSTSSAATTPPNNTFSSFANTVKEKKETKAEKVEQMKTYQMVANVTNYIGIGLIAGGIVIGGYGDIVPGIGAAVGGAVVTYLSYNAGKVLTNIMPILESPLKYKDINLRSEENWKVVEITEQLKKNTIGFDWAIKLFIEKKFQ